jgi:hypothetical protein
MVNFATSRNGFPGSCDSFCCSHNVRSLWMVPIGWKSECCLTLPSGFKRNRIQYREMHHVNSIDMNAYRIKNIGSYTAGWMVWRHYFTAELGEPSYIRKVCTDMEYFGMELDEAKNEIRSKEMREIRHILKQKLWWFQLMKRWKLPIKFMIF